MTDEQIIDLDFAYGPGESERPRHRTAVRLRAVGLAVLALACVAAFGGGARPPAAALTHLGFITWPAGALRDGRAPTLAAGLVMAEVDGEVIAYHPDGRPAWRTRPVTGHIEGLRYSSIYPWEDSILLTYSTLRTVGEGERAADIVSVAIDPATGRERWRVEGAPERVGDLIMVTAERSDGTRSRSIYRRLPDGLLWTVPPARTTLVDAATDSLMTLSAEGRFTEYQLSTGTPRRTAELRLPRVERADHEMAMVVFRGRLILRSMRLSGPDLALETLSYDRATLRPAAPSPLDRFFTVDDCGPVVCAFNFDQAYVLDGESLAELWRIETGGFPSWTGSGLLLVSSSVRLVDEWTGRDLVDTTGWIVVYGGSLNFREGMPLLTQLAKERTYMARLTPRGVQVLGSIGQQVLDCQHHEGLLACRTGDGRTGVWRLSTG